jgi:hypothetical protein
MDAPLAWFLAVLAVLSALPAWLTGAILRRHARREEAGGSEWIPLGYLPYALGRFRHPSKAVILLGYVVSNVLAWGAVVGLVVLFSQRRA